MKELLDHRASLTPEENDELDSLIDAKLDAIVALIDTMLKRVNSRTFQDR